MDAPERADQLSGLQQKTQRFSHPCRNTIARMPCPSTAVKLSTLCTRPRTSPRSSISRGAGGGRGDEDVFIAGSSFRSFSRRRSSSSSAVFFARVGASSRRVAADAPAARVVVAVHRSIVRSFLSSPATTRAREGRGRRRRRRARDRDAPRTPPKPFPSRAKDARRGVDHAPRARLQAGRSHHASESSSISLLQITREEILFRRSDPRTPTPHHRRAHGTSRRVRVARRPRARVASRSRAIRIARARSSASPSARSELNPNRARRR